MRKMDFCPPHFETVQFDLRVSENVILNWIYEHTEGRFYFGPSQRFANATGAWCVGFEQHPESSYFALLLAQLNTVPNVVY